MKTLQQILTEYGFGEPNDLSGQLIKEITDALLAELVVEKQNELKDGEITFADYPKSLSRSQVYYSAFNAAIDAYEEKKKELLG